jgi:Ni/Co efflux regulator RcnB
MKPYLFLSCLLLSACVATPPWGPPNGHFYGGHHATKHYKKHYKQHNKHYKKHYKWSRGHPLPHDVLYYDLSPRMVRHLGRPPAGHRYVRVAQDILLIAVGTGMVVDAVYDLNNM